MAVCAPIPRASERTATIENTGLRSRPRTARRKSDEVTLIVLIGRVGRVDGLLAGAARDGERSQQRHRIRVSAAVSIRQEIVLVLPTISSVTSAVGAHA